MRLVPRFSLRFLLIALTIFLIVFGVGVKYWREYQEHERVAVLLLNNSFAVEEEPVTLAGCVIGKQLTGLRIYHRSNSNEQKLLRELPNPQDLRRLTLIGEYPNGYLPEVHQTILRSSGLEALELYRFEFSAEQIQDFATFQKLEFLSLRCAKIPAEAQACFSKIKTLKTLDLSYAQIEQPRFLEDDLPNLEYLDLTGCKTDGTLDLTKQGFGRYSKLQYLLVGGLDVKRIRCEDNALAKLRFLDLGSLHPDAVIPWDELVRLAPNLEALSFNVHQLNAAALPALASWKQLRYLQYTVFGTFDNLETHPEHVQIAVLQTSSGTTRIAQYKLAIAEELVKRCPQLHWLTYENSVLQALGTPERNFEELYVRASQHWQTRDVNSN